MFCYEFRFRFEVLRSSEYDLSVLLYIYGQQTLRSSVLTINEFCQNAHLAQLPMSFDLHYALYLVVT